MTILRKLALVAVFCLAVTAFVAGPAPDATASSWYLVCEPGFNGALCEVQGAPWGSSYAWSTSGYAYIPQPCSGPFCNIGCWGSGWQTSSVTVTVTIHGLSSSQTRGIGCGSAW